MKLHFRWSLVAIYLFSITFLMTPLSMQGKSNTKNNIYKFDHISLEHGLPHNYVTDIFQDSHGYMWFATEGGLAKYNGYDLKIYSHDPNDTKSLSSNYITFIYEDTSQDLWIGTSSGINKFDKNSETFQHFLPEFKDSNNNNVNDYTITSMVEADSNLFWIGTTENGIAKFDPNTGIFKQNNYFSNYDYEYYRYSYVSSILIDSSGILWVGVSGDGLVKFDPNNNTIDLYEPEFSTLMSEDSKEINILFAESNGTLWIGTELGLSKFDKEKAKFSFYTHDPSNNKSISPEGVISIFEDQSGTLWVGTWAGLNSFNEKTGEFTQYLYDPNIEGALSDGSITSIYQDKAGTHWFGTADGGVNKLNNHHQFTNYKFDAENQDWLSGYIIYTLSEDKSDRLWIGSNSGLDVLNRKTNEMKHYTNNPEDIESLSYNTVISIYEDNLGRIWLGTQDGLNLFNKKNNNFTRVPLRNNLQDYVIYSITEDAKNNIWLSTNNELAKYDSQKNHFISFEFPNQTSSTLSGSELSYIYIDRQGVIWVGLISGLYKFTESNKTFTKYSYDSDDSLSLSNNFVRSIYEDKIGNLWIGTNKGLDLFDREKTQFTHFKESKNIPEKPIFGILEDSYGNLWLSTSKGLQKFNPKNKTFVNYDVSDGLIGNQFSNGAYSKNRKGELFFGGIGGFSLFHPDSIRDNMFVPPTKITAFKKFGKDVYFEESIEVIDEINLDYDENFISFEFTALNYINSDKNQYAYKLEGVDNSWIYCGTRRFASYTNLDPGNYIFRVKASNNVGIWNEQGSSVRINISPPFWGTWWFRIIVLFMFAMSIFLFIKIRLSSVKKQNKLLDKEVKNRTNDLLHEIEERKIIEAELKELNERKDKLFSIISHDLKSPFSALSGMTELMISDYDDLTNEEKKECLNSISISSKGIYNLLTNLLDWSRINSGRMEYEPKIIDICVLSKEVLSLLETSIKKKRLQLFNNIEPNLDAFADYNMVFSVMQNLIFNSIKFSKENDKIELKSKKLDDNIEIEVLDTGIGMDEKTVSNLFRIDVHNTNVGTSGEKGTGLGIILCKELVEKHGGELTVESSLNKGTKFNFTLPTKNL